MFKIQVFDRISESGLKLFSAGHYHIANDNAEPDAILLRSHNLHEYSFPNSVKAVGRAGAGVNNIPVDKLSQRGIPVFNTPGANANAVKELVLAGLLLACRNICSAWDFVRQLPADETSMQQAVEKGKKQFVGQELPGKTLGVIGLGAIGVKVANAALSLGMKVIGYDPAITVERAWQLSSGVGQAANLDELASRCDFITVHVPYSKATHHLINDNLIKKMKSNVVLLNFARHGIIDDTALKAALNNKKIQGYVCDFPSPEFQNNPSVITLPHLGASTFEAEENCAVMIVEQISDYLENGNIKNSVNLPDVVMPRAEGFRLAIVNANVPNMVGQISTHLADAKLNILDMLNKSRGDLAYTLLDVHAAIPDALRQKIAAIQGVHSVRTIDKIS